MKKITLAVFVLISNITIAQKLTGIVKADNGELYQIQIISSLIFGCYKFLFYIWTIK